MNIELLPLRLNVMELQQELQACQGWNLCPLRTQGKRSPHRECDDVWVRWRNTGIRPDGSFDCSWYDVADELPSAVALCETLFNLHDGVEMGGVLVTRIPPGKQVYPHIDQGWHAGHYEKFAVQVKGNRKQAFCFDSESLSPETGDVFWFRNDVPHWVTNPTDEERITLICCIRRAH